jgi:DNA helicase-2/ATP-dependent DNA helicase PcrA
VVLLTEVAKKGYNPKHMNPISDLNDQQYKAVTTDSRATLVLAGPGSGKTRVLTQRIAYLVRDLGVRPYNILAVTFTNKAAKEMKSRLSTILKGKEEGVWLGTFHSICARILRWEAGSGYLPISSNFVIYDTDDQVTLLKSIIKEMNLNDKLYRAGAIQAMISKAKNEMITPKDYLIKTSRDNTIRELYDRYEKGLRQSNAVDFDDLLLLAVYLLDQYPEVREKYAKRFEFVLVDEFQDTNSIQYELVKQLSMVHKQIFVVGDEDQSIYRWRGADYKNVLRFEHDFSNSRKILLEQNYRSTQVVLDVAKAVIDRNRNRTPKDLFTKKPGNELVHIYNGEDDRDEADYIVRTIKAQQRKGLALGSFAVMYRMNAQSRMLEEAFLKAGLPYRLVGAQRFYGRREVKDVIAYLRLVHNVKDEISLRRVINVPSRKIGDKTVDKLVEVARLSDLSLGEVLLDLAARAEKSEYWIELERAARPVWGFAHLLAGWIEAAQTASLPDLFDRILLDVEYKEYVSEGSEEEVVDRWGNVQELRRIAFEYEGMGINAFLENLALVSDQDTLPEKADAPTLLTLHAAKGLEFDQVFIIGLDDGSLPHSRAFEDEEEMAEERRLFYVGITRARNVLYLVRAQRRSMYGSYEAQLPSRFLQDLPLRLVQEDLPSAGASFGSYSRFGDHRQTRQSRWEDDGEESFFNDWQKTSGRSAANGRSYTWESAQSQRSQHAGNGSASVYPQKSDAPLKIQKSGATYQVGMQVRHSAFGEGVILNVHLEGDGEETLEIFFSNTKEKKKLAASFAKLEIIKG